VPGELLRAALCIAKRQKGKPPAALAFTLRAAPKRRMKIFYQKISFSFRNVVEVLASGFILRPQTY
jgi:hypothetical protein